MKHLAEEDRKALMEAVKEITGAKAVLIIACEETMPCSDEIKGRPCTGHMTQIMNTGFENNGWLAGLVKKVYSSLSENDIDD